MGDGRVWARVLLPALGSAGRSRARRTGASEDRRGWGCSRGCVIDEGGRPGSMDEGGPGAESRLSVGSSRKGRAGHQGEQMYPPVSLCS